VSGILVKFLIDTGASRSLIQSETFSKFRIFSARTTDIRLETLTGQKIETDGQVDLTLDKIGDQSFIIIPDMENEGILGNDFLEQYKAKIDYEAKVIEVQGIKLPFCSVQAGYAPRIAKVTEVIDRPSWLSDIDGHEVFRPEI